MGQINGRERFSTPPPQLGDPRSIFRKLEIYNYFPDTTSHAKKISGEYVDVGGLGK